MPLPGIAFALKAFAFSAAAHIVTYLFKSNKASCLPDEDVWDVLSMIVLKETGKLLPLSEHGLQNRLGSTKAIQFRGAEVKSAITAFKTEHESVLVLMECQKFEGPLLLYNYDDDLLQRTLQQGLAQCLREVQAFYQSLEESKQHSLRQVILEYRKQLLPAKHLLQTFCTFNNRSNRSHDDIKKIENMIRDQLKVTPWQQFISGDEIIRCCELIKKAIQVTSRQYWQFTISQELEVFAGDLIGIPLSVLPQNNLLKQKKRLKGCWSRIMTLHEARLPNDFPDYAAIALPSHMLLGQMACEKYVEYGDRTRVYKGQHDTMTYNASKFSYHLSNEEPPKKYKDEPDPIEDERLFQLIVVGASGQSFTPRRESEYKVVKSVAPLDFHIKRRGFTKTGQNYLEKFIAGYGSAREWFTGSRQREIYEKIVTWNVATMRKSKGFGCELSGRRVISVDLHYAVSMLFITMPSTPSGGVSNQKEANDLLARIEIDSCKDTIGDWVWVWLTEMMEGTDPICNLDWEQWKTYGIEVNTLRQSTQGHEKINVWSSLKDEEYTFFVGLRSIWIDEEIEKRMSGKQSHSGRSILTPQVSLQNILTLRRTGTFLFVGDQDKLQSLFCFVTFTHRVNGIVKGFLAHWKEMDLFMDQATIRKLALCTTLECSSSPQLLKENQTSQPLCLWMS